MLLEKDSPADLFLRGFSREEILGKTGVDVGYHGRTFAKRLRGIDRKGYKLEFVRENFDEDAIRAAIFAFADGADADSVLRMLGVANPHLAPLKWLFGELGFADEFASANAKHRHDALAKGMTEKYGVANPFELQEFQDAAKQTRKERYGAEFTLSEGSSLAQGVRETFAEHMRDEDFREELAERRTATVRERFGVDHQMQSEIVKAKAAATRGKTAAEIAAASDAVDMEHPVHLSAKVTHYRAKQFKRNGKRMTTETFVEAASWIHGGFYSYGKTQFVRMVDKVTITCPEHGDFEQAPDKHLAGHGCAICANKARLTKVSFIAKARAVHGDEYGYDKVDDSVSTNSKVTITCPEHGDFEQIAHNHLSGRKCPKCARERCKQTNLERYGVEYPLQSATIREKMRQTNLERYGVESSFQSVEIRDKAKQTMLERYGAAHPMQSADIREKMKQTNLDRHGVEYALQSAEIKEKIKQTNLERYGVENSFQSSEIQEKVKQTNLERYGVATPTQSAAVKEKAKQTNLERYGVEHPMQSAEVKDKMLATKEANGTFNSSSIEDDFIARTGFIPQYRDEERYPFACDAYDPETDTFIEINAHWTHGGHWFDQGSAEDAAKLRRLNSKAMRSQFYVNAADVWTKRDVEKREWARAHNLNYVVFWDAKGTDMELWLAMGRPVGHDWEREYSWLPERPIPRHGDAHRMRLSWRNLTALVKEAQRPVFYATELDMWDADPYRNQWGTLHGFLFSNRYRHMEHPKLPDEITDAELLRGFRISGVHIGFTSFDSEMMRTVIADYGVKSVYDPCSGWGERMMTCGMLGVSYEGCDINEALQPGYRKLAELVDGFEPVLHVGDSAEQDVTGNPDAIITCPPYMDVEVYTEHGAENMSEADFAGWWRKVCAKVSASSARVFAVQTNQACRQLFLEGMRDAGWTLDRELRYARERKSHFHRTSASNKKEFESMLVMAR